MLRVLAGIKAEPVSNVLPKELSIIVNDLSSDMPTHMFAVFSSRQPATSRRRVTLFPAHNLVFATHCANLPILQLGSPIARTDGNGVAHFVLRVKPAEQITLTLDTGDKGAEGLRPQNPTLQFVAKDQDDFILLEQKFRIEKKKVHIKVAPRPTPL